MATRLITPLAVTRFANDGMIRAGRSTTGMKKMQPAQPARRLASTRNDRADQQGDVFVVRTGGASNQVSGVREKRFV